MELAQIMSVCGVSGIISGLVGVLIAVYLRRSSSISAEKSWKSG